MPSASVTAFAVSTAVRGNDCAYALARSETTPTMRVVDVRGHRAAMRPNATAAADRHEHGVEVRTPRRNFEREVGPPRDQLGSNARTKRRPCSLARPCAWDARLVEVAAVHGELGAECAHRGVLAARVALGTTMWQRRCRRAANREALAVVAARRALITPAPPAAARPASIEAAAP